MTEHWENLNALTAPLLTWYDLNGRTLPWRSVVTPYRTWVSEIMLQQTRVSAVIPYFERFMAELPDAAALATVPEERLLKLWEGLGYYSRARNLQKAAKVIVSDFGGELPRTCASLKTLPGIGDYTPRSTSASRSPRWTGICCASPRASAAAPTTSWTRGYESNSPRISTTPST